MGKVEITTNGIKHRLKTYDAKEALCEYIWNGFDAGASKIEIIYETNPIHGVEKLSVIDNGHGILDPLKFKLFLESHKNTNQNQKKSRSSSRVKGQDGIGRLSFFKFAERATWETTIEKVDKKYRYTIDVSSNNLDHYDETSEIELDEGNIGTKVEFLGLRGLTEENMKGDIYDHLCSVFAWLLELNKEKKFAIYINGKELDYEKIILDSKRSLFEIKNQKFSVSFILWRHKLKEEYSRYYFLKSNGEETYTTTTKLNQKSDNFHHSLYIESSFFDNKPASFFELSRAGRIANSTLDGKTYNSLMERVDNLLQDKKRDFLKKNADTIIEKYDKSDIFPKFKKNAWDGYRKTHLKEFVKELYIVEPKIFSNLNTEQKKIFVRFINLIIESDNEKDKIINILGEVINLSSVDLDSFNEILKRSKLSSIVKTINLIEARCEVIAQLKELVFNKSLNANEVKHIQGFIENHYWIFGEQYHLVTAAEPKFDEALRRFVEHHKGKNAKVVPMDHPDKNREMDIFMTRQIISEDSISNIVVELKHPKVLLGEKELSQVKRYMRALQSNEQFNGDNMTWNLFLVGNKFDTTNYIEEEIKNAKSHGEKHLVFNNEKYKIYCLRWSEVITNFEIRYDHILKILQLQRDDFVSKEKSADEILEDSSVNSAAEVQDSR